MTGTSPISSIRGPLLNRTINIYNANSVMKKRNIAHVTKLVAKNEIFLLTDARLTNEKYNKLEKYHERIHIAKSREFKPIYGTVIIFPENFIKKTVEQRHHRATDPCYNMTAIVNCQGQFEIYAALYLPPGGQKSTEIIDSFQEDLEGLALSLGANPVIFIGADLNIDIDEIDRRPRDRAVYNRTIRMLDDFALIDLYRQKFECKIKNPGYTFYPNNNESKPSRIDYLFVSRQYVVDMTLPGEARPLQHTKVEIIDKAMIASDHNGIRWQIASQPPFKLTDEQKIDRCKFKPAILNDENTRCNVLRQIYNNINPGARVCNDRDLESEIKKADEANFKTKDSKVGNAIDVLERIIKNIKIIQIEDEKKKAITRNRDV